MASFHLGEAEGRCYIVQEYVEAESLSNLLARRGALSEHECVSLLRQVLRGLKAAHDVGIVHRDIKTSNILVNKDGIAFITDFGLAFSMRQGTKVRLAGTPRYMAPELFDGAPAGASTDLYACGVMLYHILTGQFPFSGRSFTELGQQHKTLSPAEIPGDARVSATARQLLPASAGQESGRTAAGCLRSAGGL